MFNVGLGLSLAWFVWFLILGGLPHSSGVAGTPGQWRVALGPKLGFEQFWAQNWDLSGEPLGEHNPKIWGLSQTQG